MAIIQNKTLILLIDFHGHPILGDDHTNNLRYSELMYFLNEQQFQYNIVSNHLKGEHTTERGPNKLRELKRIVDIEGVHNWDVIDPDREPAPSIEEIENIFKNRNYRINNVILGGTNLAGCVLRSKPYSAIHWAKRGYRTQIYLPMCADYELPGVNQVERMMAATSVMYNVIREERLWRYIDLVRERNGLAKF
jgi:hypothetical protein|tara:strand:+ start:2141 stop:2719 length:579 start_codon:yes stop_codon:yes gene_type:complete